MTKLEQAPAEESALASHSMWGLRHQLWLLGAVLLFAAAVGAVWLYHSQPVSPFQTIDPEQVRQSAKSLPPTKTWDYWTQMKQGLDQRIDETYETALTRFRIWEGVAGVVALIGIILIGAGFQTKRRQEHGPQISAS